MIVDFVNAFVNQLLRKLQFSMKALRSREAALSADYSEVHWDRERLPFEGEIFSFKTWPVTPLSPKDTGRFAAFKTLAVEDSCLAIAVLDKFWTAQPTPDQVICAGICKSEGEYAGYQLPSPDLVFRISKPLWKLEGLPGRPESLQSVVATVVSDNELALLQGYDQDGDRETNGQFANFDSVNHWTEIQWRWRHDRAQLQLDIQDSRDTQRIADEAREDREKQRLKKLTFDVLLSETFFENWYPSQPYPSEEFTLETRSLFVGVCTDIQALGAKPKKSEVRAILKNAIETLNYANSRYDCPIETEERAEIIKLVEEIAWAAKQKNLADEADSWREW